jgi:hypothetical protein
MATGRTPRTGFTSPERASSPTRWTPARASGGTASMAARSARAMGRSKPVPSLRRSPGARFTTIRFDGIFTSTLRIAAATRIFASCTARSARPTRWTCGIPWPASTSTSTGKASTPRSVAERARTSMHVRSARRVPPPGVGRGEADQGVRELPRRPAGARRARRSAARTRYRVPGGATRNARDRAGSASRPARARRSAWRTPRKKRGVPAEPRPLSCTTNAVPSRRRCRSTAGRWSRRRSRWPRLRPSSSSRRAEWCRSRCRSRDR